MAFARSGLIAASYGPGKTKAWIYTTADALATVVGANYFDSAVDLLNKGDIIMGVYATGGTPVQRNLVVTANSGTAITVAKSDVSA